jgi:hypothetical protein
MKNDKLGQSIMMQTSLEDDEKKCPQITLITQIILYFFL